MEERCVRCVYYARSGKSEKSGFTTLNTFISSEELRFSECAFRARGMLISLRETRTRGVEGAGTEATVFLGIWIFLRASQERSFARFRVANIASLSLSREKSPRNKTASCAASKQRDHGDSFNFSLNKLAHRTTELPASSELIKIRFHCFRWPGKFAGLMMIPARAPDELLIAELPPRETSRFTENYGRLPSIGTAICTHFIIRILLKRVCIIVLYFHFVAKIL